MTDNNCTKNSLLFQLEKDIAEFLLKKLEHFDISLDRASQIAKYILAHLPENLTDEQIIGILPSLDDEFVELAGIIHQTMLEFEEQHKDVIVKEINDLIKNKHFDEANKLAKEYFQKKFPV